MGSLLHRRRWRSGHPLALQPPRPGPAPHVNAFPGISAGPLEELCCPHLPIPQGGQSWGAAGHRYLLSQPRPQHSLLLPLTVTPNSRWVCNRDPRLTTPGGAAETPAVGPLPWGDALSTQGCWGRVRAGAPQDNSLTSIRLGCLGGGSRCFLRPLLFSDPRRTMCGFPTDSQAARRGCGGRVGVAAGEGARPHGLGPHSRSS